MTNKNLYRKFLFFTKTYLESVLGITIDLDLNDGDFFSLLISYKMGNFTTLDVYFLENKYKIFNYINEEKLVISLESHLTKRLTPVKQFFYQIHQLKNI